MTRSWENVKKLRKPIEKVEESCIIKSKVQKDEDFRVKIVGHIDIEIYRCITDDITTDEVIITDTQIEHIKHRHPYIYEKFYAYLPEIIAEPDYILEANKPDSGVILKEINIENKVFKLVLRIATSKDAPSYKNSIITFMKIDQKDWKRLIRNKKILYKKE